MELPEQLDLLHTIKTKEDAFLLLHELDLVLKAYYNEKTTAIEEVLTHSLRPSTSQKIRALMSALASQKKSVQEACLEVKAGIEKLRPLTLTLAFEPPEETVELLFSWVRTNIGSSIILDLQYNKNLIAGAIIIYQGNYKDLTIKKKLQNQLDKQAMDILSMIR